MDNIVKLKSLNCLGELARKRLIVHVKENSRGSDVRLKTFSKPALERVEGMWKQ